MPDVKISDFVNKLSQRVETEMNAADADGNAHLNAGERAQLPADVRALADSTAESYFAGGPLPTQAYVDAYRNFVASVAQRVDVDGSAKLDPSELASLPASVASSWLALQTGAASLSPASSSLDAQFAQLSQGGWTDEGLMTFIHAANQQGQLQAYANDIWNAVLKPHLEENAAAGPRFFEALAWYTDKTQAGSSDGRFTKSELNAALYQKANAYFAQVGDGSPQGVDQRKQTWKWVQKLRMLEGEMDRLGVDSYAYDPQKMMNVNASSAWNQAHTIDSPAEFMQDVLQASYEKPVLVKYGLTYCMHCLLLEQLDSVHAIDTKYGGDVSVKKLWWNPKSQDPEMRAVTAVAQEQGVTSSPWFIVYENGQAVRSGYAFPDEQGNGVEPLLQGMV